MLVWCAMPGVDVYVSRCVCLCECTPPQLTFYAMLFLLSVFDQPIAKKHSKVEESVSCEGGSGNGLCNPVCCSLCKAVWYGDKHHSSSIFLFYFPLQLTSLATSQLTSLVPSSTGIAVRSVCANRVLPLLTHRKSAKLSSFSTVPKPLSVVYAHLTSFLLHLRLRTLFFFLSFISFPHLYFLSYLVLLCPHTG